MEKEKSPEQVEAELRKEYKKRGYTETEIERAVKHDFSVAKAETFAKKIIAECRAAGFTYIEMALLADKIKFEVDAQLTERVDAIRRSVF